MLPFRLNATFKYRLLSLIVCLLSWPFSWKCSYAIYLAAYILDWFQLALAFYLVNKYYLYCVNVDTESKLLVMHTENKQNKPFI